MSKEDGGKAFPSDGRIYNHEGNVFGNWGGSSGMTLRDYFAAAALTGMLMTEIRETSWAHSEKLSLDAYKVADAMIGARKK